MKPQHFALLAGLLLLIAGVLIITGKPQPLLTAGKGETDQPGHVVTVTGEGEIRLKPDLVWVSLGVWTTGPSATEAEGSNLAFVREIRGALIAAGVEEAGLEVTPVTVNTTTRQDFAGVTRIAEFQARSVIRAPLRNLAKVQSVVDAALGAGATSVESVAYTLENPEQAKQQAMKLALENARARSNALVKTEGGRLGELRAIEVLSEDSPVSATSPGSLVFRARVKATFEY